MTTKEEIINIADQLIKDKGYNGFSFKDISESIGIKTASIHYHFPSKSDLGIAVIKAQIERFDQQREATKAKSPKRKLEAFFDIYVRIKADHMVCLVGALATDFNTIELRVQEELKVLAEGVLHWVTEILKEGKTQKVFHFSVAPRTKAIMVISNMLAIVQLSRLTKSEDFELVKNTIIKELTSKQI
ncbi:TetR/AcrR family transcriptional regulator [Taibaiella sp. KBW10]|uniref:TetR/AcrR family transcriptional regulator n=1 Tax=Taibaiella sp. KBW10 TaxID=2153357 RepID=UPI000F5A77FF|nr:TetR/AcrR family transcriptional regulator [Taibaiella sp. KBW10]RQO30023.1 TetR/AcrR family transcriptional regulator [Taibaiella sp. KBW10]